MWARCLLRIEGKTQCVRGVVMEYLEEKNKYKFRYAIEEGQRGVLVPRIFLCSDLEDPGRYCERVSKAYFSRLYADNLIKFNYYVGKMPTEGLSLIEEEQRQRMKVLTGQPNSDENSFEGLMEEAQGDYWRAMNAIILRKHLAENRHNLVPTHLSVSLAKPKKSVDAFGLL